MSDEVEPDNPLEAIGDKAMALREKLGRQLTAEEAIDIVETEMERFETERGFPI